MRRQMGCVVLVFEEYVVCLGSKLLFWETQMEMEEGKLKVPVGDEPLETAPVQQPVLDLLEPSGEGKGGCKMRDRPPSQEACIPREEDSGPRKHLV